MTAGRFLVVCIVGLTPLLTAAMPGISMAAEPVITCPPGPVNVSASKMSQVTIDLPIQGADSVYMPAGSWKNGRFTFVASRQGPWALTVFAFSGGERTACVIKVNVRFDDTAAPQYADEPLHTLPSDKTTSGAQVSTIDRFQAVLPEPK